MRYYPHRWQASASFSYCLSSQKRRHCWRTSARRKSLSSCANACRSVSGIGHPTSSDHPSSCGGRRICFSLSACCDRFAIGISRSVYRPDRSKKWMTCWSLCRLARRVYVVARPSRAPSNGSRHRIGTYCLLRGFYTSANESMGAAIANPKYSNPCVQFAKSLLLNLALNQCLAFDIWVEASSPTAAQYSLREYSFSIFLWCPWNIRCRDRAYYWTRSANGAWHHRWVDRCRDRTGLPIVCSS